MSKSPFKPIYQKPHILPGINHIENSNSMNQSEINQTPSSDCINPLDQNNMNDINVNPALNKSHQNSSSFKFKQWVND